MFRNNVVVMKRILQLWQQDIINYEKTKNKYRKLHKYKIKSIKSKMYTTNLMRANNK